MSILILADHDDGQLAPATLNTVTAAREIGGDIHILVAGEMKLELTKSSVRHIRGFEHINQTRI